MRSLRSRVAAGLTSTATALDTLIVFASENMSLTERYE
jgi:hypothetical protein